MKVGFVLLSPSERPIPSTRVAVLNTLPHLRARGWTAEIVAEPREPGAPLRLDVGTWADAGYDVICFQKVVGSEAEHACRELRRRGIRTAFLVCDLVDVGMAEATDVTVIVTEFLKQQYPSSLRHKIHVVHDGIERPEVVKRAWREDAGTRARPLTAVLVTSATLEHLPVLSSVPAWLQVRVVGNYWPGRGRLARLREVQWTLRRQASWHARREVAAFQLSPRTHRVPWSPDGVYDELANADLGIIPIDTPLDADRPLPNWMVKSENRLTLKMSVGLPVIATPIPAYETVVDQGKNAILARSRAEWLHWLERLRDPALRREIGQNARMDVIERFSIARQSELLMKAIGG